MTITISYTALLLTILTGAVVAAMVYLIVVLARIQRVTGQMEAAIDKTDQVLDALKHLSDEATGTVIAARILIDEGHLITSDVAAISARVRGFAESAGHASTVIERIKATLAIIAGVRTAITTVKRFLEHRRQTAEETNQESLKGGT